MTEHEFLTTYRGVEAPSWVMEGADDEPAIIADIRIAFKAGVDAAYSTALSAAKTAVATSPSFGELEPNREKVWVDEDGDFWYYRDDAWHWSHYADLRLGIFAGPWSKVLKDFWDVDFTKLQENV